MAEAEIIKLDCLFCGDTGREEIYMGSTRYIDRYVSVPCRNGCKPKRSTEAKDA